MSNNLRVTRNEFKYYISNLQYKALINKLQHILSPDPYTQPGQGYFIRSLYFDSHNDICLQEKQSGQLIRKKYRMRTYDPLSNKVKFEIKHRHNNQIYKETASINKECAKQVIGGNYKALLDYNNPILNKIYTEFVKGNYRPKVIIDYWREAYVFDFFNLRITIDKNLHSNNTDFDIFSTNLHTIPVILEGKQILEIKYERVIPDFIRQSIQIDSFERMAISKYVLGRRFFKLEAWEDN